MTADEFPGRATNRLSTLVRVELWQLLDQTNTTQVELAQKTGFSVKHINQMLQGKVGITPENADELLAVFGRQLVIGTAPKPDAVLPDVIANGKRGANARPPAEPLRRPR